MGRLAVACGVALDALHLPLALLVMVLGPLWLPAPAALVPAFAAVAAQALLRDCPLNVLSDRLRACGRRPPPARRRSLVRGLYHRYGRTAALAILAKSILVSELVAYLARR